MMKKLLCVGILFLVVFQPKAQDVDYGIAINYKLLMQLTENQSVRMMSEEAYQRNYKKQRKLYEKINEDVGKVLAVHEFIYNKLSTVNKLLIQGKKLKYFWFYMEDIKKNGNKLMKLTTANPKYAVLLTDTYNELLQQCLVLSTEVSSSILKEGKDFLIDPYDREILIEKMLDKARMINGYILYLITRLEEVIHIAYLKQIPILKNWISLDNAIVEDIMLKWKILKQ